MSVSDQAVGRPLSRVDGKLKVTGRAKYTAEWPVENAAYGALIVSTIACGKIDKFDTSAAEKAPGVVAVITPGNALRLESQEQKVRPGVDPKTGEPLHPLQDDLIRYAGQPIGVIVADTFEHARHALSLVRVRYEQFPARLDFRAAAAHALVPGAATEGDQAAKRLADYDRGDFDQGFNAADVHITQTYSIPAEYHNPMEPHATTAVWNGSKLTLYDKTQWVDNVAEQVGLAFSLPKESVRVISPFVGGAFGSALRVWPHVLIAALAAKQTQLPVKLVLTRAEYYRVTGYRPHSVQEVSLGAARDGTLKAVRHLGTGQTSMYEEYTESLLQPTRLFYACPNLSTRYRLAAMNVNTPASMRGPGEASGMFALESAIDELAAAVGVDPVEIRIRNHASIDPESGLPWSSKSLKECYAQAAERFGWNRRQAKPRSVREGNLLIGCGMASATWPTHRQPATVRVRISDDGTALVQTAASDIGPGTYTVMTQIAADALGLAVHRVTFELGDSSLPKAPVEGGSMTVASVGTAVHEAAKEARQKLLALVQDDPRSPLRGVPTDHLVVEQGRVSAKLARSHGETFSEILKRHGRDKIEVVRESKLPKGKPQFATRAFGAQFVEVAVDRDFGTVRVRRVVSAFAGGRIINPKTARSQAIGGIVGGIGMALLEEAIRDPRNASVVNANLADYHVPVNADIPEIDAFYLDEADAHVNPIGAKGIAELSLVGVAAAIANAVYNATGKRIRNLPITPEKLL